MLRAMDSAVAGLRAHQNKMDVIGNNIANVNTFGFKSQSYSFKEAMYQTSTASTGGVSGTGAAGGTNAAQYGYGTMMGSISMDMTGSTPSYVGGFNACIDGEGFFITRSTNQTDDAGFDVDALKASGMDFTRVGQFNIDSNGYLVDANQNFIYGFRRTGANTEANGGLATTLQPLKVPSDGAYGYDADSLQLKDVQINSAGEVTGTVVSDDALDGTTISLGKVAIATFQNPNGLTKSGSGYYNTSDGDNTGASSATIPGGSSSMLMTGYLEASNVDLAKEFSEMITTQRGFQANSKIITVSDEMLSDLISMKR
ncbi:MAG: flagellar hook-basal body complex protein [Clostridium sp.]|nr:flagellar hook-basal body complex protein [Clostridium sp.]